MKRKASELGDFPATNGENATKKYAARENGHDIRGDFRKGLFDGATLKSFKAAYDTSKPYPHHVIAPLMNQTLLESVRNEIQGSLSFTPKQTDIYRIHQTGDLANLSGLDSKSLSRLPSLLQLRNALYSEDFRSYLSEITGSGPLSGTKTDMAINVYTPGCHLLCHDDVIGSRRVSYILYLTDPAEGKQWKPEWGGALRLYPTTSVQGTDDVRTPLPDPSVVIPPAFNQLSYFAVRPGESFHDVEEVYHAGDGEDGDNADRVRMAISGWFHVPQKGEKGYVPGVEEQWAEKSSLIQLQGKAAEGVDFPQPAERSYEDGDEVRVDERGKAKPQAKNEEEEEEEEEDMLSEAELTFLLDYIAPTYLTPATLSSLSSLFLEESSLRVDSFLTAKFADKLKSFIESEGRDVTLPSTTEEIESHTSWKVARPPHKHKYLYRQLSDPSSATEDPLQDLFQNLFPSRAFRKWLCLATSSRLDSYNILTRRFRRGVDYTLASGGAEEETSHIELTLGLTPSCGWDEGDEVKADADAEGEEAQANGVVVDPDSKDDEEPGGYEVYMASGEEDAADKKDENDPAVYRSTGANGEDADADDDGILFSTTPGWNRLSIVLRDAGVLRFVKYVSRNAPGDRWDITGEFRGELLDPDSESENDDGADEIEAE